MNITMNTTIEYLIYTNIFAISIFILQIIIKTIFSILRKNKDDLVELKIRVKFIQEYTEKIPKMIADINAAHERIRRLERKEGI